jgi:hypothetical protein
MHWGYSLILLTVGDFKNGWEEFEWRLRAPELGFHRGFSQPQWDGSNFPGKTLLLHAEGGFGDAIHFVRYVPLVSQRGGTIVLECRPELASLMTQVPGIQRVIPKGETLPAFDFHIPLQSLPRIFQTTLETIPASVPYLGALEVKARYWQDRVRAAPGPKLKVGLVWAGSNTNSPEDQRSRSLETFAPLASIPGIQFYSLQKGPEAVQPVPEGLSLVSYADELRDFTDTAGLVANLDLVISVDTSVVHLAGAMAKPVWTLVPAKCDFRWLLGREDSPWYPTVRLFRQKKGDKWNVVVGKIAEELRLAARR